MTPPHWLIGSRSFKATTAFETHIPVTWLHTPEKKASSKMPPPFPGITLNSDVVLAVFAVFGAR